MRLFSTVEDSFQIEGRGCFITLRMPKNASRTVQHKEAIRLVSPDGSALETQIDGIEITKKGLLEKLSEDLLAIRLPDSIKQTEVPSGTEVWLLNE